MSIIENWTDVYFKKTRTMVKMYGDIPVVYGVFVRSDSLVIYKGLIPFMQQMAWDIKSDIELILPHNEGDFVHGQHPLFFYKGSMEKLLPVEPFVLQHTSFDGMVAYEAASMTKQLPTIPFVAMDFRHNINLDMAERTAYAVSVGSQYAQQRGAKGFVANATDKTAHYFSQSCGFGTMPHAFIGYTQGDVVKAARMYRNTFPDEPLVVLIDYNGAEISDSLRVCKAYETLTHTPGQVKLRMDTPSDRYVEGLNQSKSIQYIGFHTTDPYLIGYGTSAASFFHLRNALDSAGYQNVQLIASSGFSLEKCRSFAQVNVPVDTIGTGSFFNHYTQSLATADIIQYGNEYRVKKGRKSLIDFYKTHVKHAKKITLKGTL